MDTKGQTEPSTHDSNAIQEIGEIILEEMDHVERELLPAARIPFHPGMDDNEAQLYVSREAVRRQLQDGRSLLHREPLIAYVKVEVDGQQEIYLFCRPCPPLTKSGTNRYFGSRNAPLGELASQPAGSRFTHKTPKGERRLTVLERNVFVPQRHQGKWDATNNSLSLTSGDVHIRSIIELLSELQIARQTLAPTHPDLIELERALREELYRSAKITDGIRRDILRDMQLRDQPILDAFQDKIARFPLNEQFILTGAPGTGKTTILIKRIAIKSDLIGNKPELDKFTGLLRDDGLSWILFVPNDLFKGFLKEALAKENIPAPEDRLKTWLSFRLELARSLKLLGSKESGAAFRSVPSGILKITDNRDLIRLNNGFRKFHLETVIQTINIALDDLVQKNWIPEITLKVQRLSIIRNTEVIKDVQGLLRAFEEFYELSPVLGDHHAKIKESVESMARAFDKADLLDNVIGLMESMASVDVEEDEETQEEDESSEGLLDKRVRAFVQLRNAVRWHARRVAIRDNRASKSLNAQIVNLIIRKPEYSIEQFTELGRKLLSVRSCGQLVRGVSHLLEDVPKHYKKYRLNGMKERNALFTEHSEALHREQKVQLEEIEVMLFQMLQNARQIRKSAIHHVELVKKNLVMQVTEREHRSQILIDEATDFSTIQIGCMYYLADPRTESVVLSGDLMQRLTEFGLTAWSELEIVSRSINKYEITLAYRQSNKLLEIAKILYRQFIGREPSYKSVYTNPVTPNPLKHVTDDYSELARWLTSRILEIQRFCNDELPSIAVFVPSKPSGESIECELKPMLEEVGILCELCLTGQPSDDSTKVRIFDVRLIKGFEFECVFFIDIDLLEALHPKLIDKYLYVGVTRASSFLAVTYRKRFPRRLEKIESEFHEGDWSEL